MRGRARALVRFAAVSLGCALAYVGSASAQGYPSLTGRVVDDAKVLPAETRSALDARLKANEDKTTDQVVVATVSSLGGREIEDYANGLYRAWKLGTGDKNNGVLLLVAPNERKVRIEVGYGLEGALTDALTGTIIRTAIAPRFKAGDFPGGISAGTDAILSILSNDATEWGRGPKAIRQDGAEPVDWMTIAICLLILFIVLRSALRAGAPGSVSPYRRRGGAWIVPTGGGGWGGGGWSSGSGGFGGGDGGGFSGGGGSSGGGGASGSW